MKELSISKRLDAICSFVSPGAVLLDVGTDHAYVPIYLIGNGIVDRAWASDINPGPLMIAEENARVYGLSEKIVFYLSDGLDSCRCYENKYDHIVIAGMGGELIFDILNRSHFVREYRPLLILQPMTMQPYLRRELSSHGFSILKDIVVFEDNKFYTVMTCRYDGYIDVLDDFEMNFGKDIRSRARDGEPGIIDYLNRQRFLLNKISEGKKLGNQDHGKEDQLVRSVTELLNEVSK